MAGPYEEAEVARFAVETTDRGKRFTVRPPHGVLRVVCLLSCFGAMSAVGAQFMQLMLTLPADPVRGIERPFSAELVVCTIVGIAALAVALFLIALTSSWMLGGAEILDVSAGDLVVTHRMWGVARTKRYKGSDVVEIVEHAASPFQANQIGLPILWAAKTGSVRFTYGARTMYLAQGLDQSESRLLAAALRESLLVGGARRLRGSEL